ncbi:mycofactocin-coupled SDR family oxidoreductase [Nocardia vermiculata]|uniref:Mycofactocin-coupled SDR family oxidoreductase n=1 Tax=Nocardia vermiculata TaxID=257274 RepID=A0A846Y4L7_9NOCA|nr:mycofactocin-coupled SDR family oxidoreductase [Nocardia vermiculata]NKY54173.1 mycofactocin-coupled SDR family oxidoreductase [Nocardia vermiculata]
MQGKTVLVTGAAQSQGRSHAVAMAEAGADIIAVDSCRQLDIVPYRMGTEEGLAETARLVEATGRGVHAAQVDVRDRAGLEQAVAEGVDRFGSLDVALANASICTVQPYDEVTDEIWRTTLDVNLTGVWHTCAAAIPHLVANGGGNIVITGSTGSTVGLPFYLPYVAAKHALVGVCRSLALELADRNIRVNMINPTGVDTPQGHSTVLPGLLEARPDLGPIFMNSLPVDRIEASDVTKALLFLASDDARYVTGAALPVDAGSTIR